MYHNTCITRNIGSYFKVVELEVAFEHINAYNDPVFTGYRNQNVSDSDSSDSDKNDAI